MKVIRRLSLSVTLACFWVAAAVHPTGGSSLPPASVSLQPEQFAATVGATNNRVTWPVDGHPSGNHNIGTISITGLYAASTAPLTVTTASLPNGVAGAAYSATLSASGGTAPYAWSIVTGSLPPGIALAGGATVAGTPSASGYYKFSLQVQDAAGARAIWAYGMSVAAAPVTVSVSPASASLYPGKTQQFAAAVTGTANTAVTWTVSPAAGAISASSLYTAPAAIASASSVTITATSVADATKSASAVVALTPLTPLVITSSALPAGTTARPYVAALAVTGGVGPYVWSVSSGQLAPGLNLASSGVVSGVPSASGTYTAVVQAKDAAGQLVSQTFSIAIAAALTVTSTSLPNGVAGTAYSATLSASGGTSPYAWSIVTGSLPPGITLAGGGSVAGTPSASGYYKFSLQVQDAAGRRATWAYGMSVAAAPVTVSVTPATASLSVGQTQQFTAMVGGTTNTGVTWSVSPPVGTTTSGGLYTAPTTLGSPQTVTVTATSVADTSKRATASMTIVPPVQVTVSPSTASLAPSGTQQFTAAVTGTTNKALTWSVNGATGGNSKVGTVSNTGLYAGPASLPSPLSVTVTATSLQDLTKSAAANVMVTPPVTVTVSPGTVSLGVGQTQQFSATVIGSLNTSVSWSVSPAVGTISGGGLYSAPAALGSPQTVTVTATSVADTSKTAAAGMTIVPPVQVTVSPSTASLAPSGTQQFTAAVTGTTNTAVTWSVSPAVGIISSGGLYSAPATLDSPQTITVAATSVADTSKQATASVTVTPPVTVSLTPTAATMLPSQAQTFTAAVGGTTNTGVTWSIAPATGTISSSGLYTTPSTISSTSSVGLTATSVADATKSASATITLIPAIQITTASLPDGTAGTAYSAAVSATGGTPPYTWFIPSDQLPPGTSLSTGTGVISGTPTTAGSYNVTMKVTDAAAYQATAALAIVIAAAACTSCPGLGITTTSLPDGTVGSAYSATLAGIGGTSPYTWSISAGQLPPGLTLSSAAGVISGTPSSTGSYSFTAMVTDSASPPNTASQDMVLTVGSLDSYGGRSDLQCAGGAKTRFYTEKIAGRWWLCTPAGHAFFAQGPYGVNLNRTLANAKYGTTANAFQQTVVRLKSWGFNYSSTYSAPDMLAWHMTANKFPAVLEFRPATYAENNATRPNNPYPPGLLDQNLKELSSVVSPYFRNVTNNGMPDWGDLTRIRTGLDWMMTESGSEITAGLASPSDLPYLLGIAVEDSDQTWGYFTSVANNPFDTQPGGNGAAHGGYMTALLSPKEQVNPVRGASFLGDPVVYVKKTMHDYLVAKYTTIGALNTAWGSTYTTFDSGATTTTGESIGSTNGTDYEYPHTIRTAGNLTPHTIKVYEDGTLVAGDCFHPSKGDICNPPPGGNISGGLWGTGMTGLVNYSTGSITVDFTEAWIMPDEVDCIAGVSCTAWYTGALFPIPDYAVGDHIAAKGFPTTQFAVANAIVATQGTASHTFSGTYCSPTTVTATYITYPWSGATVTNHGICSGDQGRTTKLLTPTSGHVITVTYDVNGWYAGGTGLMDEDGRPSHTWMGTDPYTSGCGDQLCDPYTLHTLNANTAADLRGVMYTIAHNYFASMKAGIQAPFIAAGVAAPLYLGPDSLGTWTSTPVKEVLQAASDTVDVAIFGGYASYSLTSPMLSFIASWYAHPFIDGVFLRANPDSPYAATANEYDYATQALRGAGYLTVLTSYLATAATSGRVGFGWWTYQDGDCAGANCTNWGLTTLLDNAYDGHESVSSVVSCSVPINAYACGGESGNYGDVITSVKAGNALWHSSPAQ